MRQASISIASAQVRAPIDLRAAERCVRRSRDRFLPAVLALFAFLCASGPAAHAQFTCSWTDASDNWTTTGDWSGCNGTFPNNGGGNTYDVTISNGEPALTTAVTIGSVTITSPGSWTINGPAGSATLTGSVTNSGTAGLHDSAALTVDGGFGNSGTLEVDNGFSEAPVTGEGGSSLTITGTLANTGTVQVGNPNLSAPTTVTIAGLTNPAGASFALEGSASHAADLVFSGGGSGFTSNGGNFELTYASPLTLSAALTNSGTFGVHQNTTLGVDGGFGNSGTLEVDNGFSEAPVTGEGGSSLTITGTLANTGTVQVGNPNLSAPTTVTLGGLTNPAGASFALEGSASHAADLVFSGGGSGFTSNGGNFELTYASPLTLSAALTNSGTFGVHQNTTLGVDGGFGNSGTLEVDNGFSEAPVTGEGGSSLTITGTLANTGTVQVGNPNLSAPTTVTLGGLTNPAGASFALEGSASHAADLVFSGGGSGFTSNGGNFELTYASPLTLSAALTNSGTFGVHQNTTLGVDGGFGNSGTLEVDNGFSEAPVTGEGGSSLTITGTLANTGTVQVGNPNLSAPTTVTLGGLTNPAGASFALEGSASHAADLVFSGGGSGFTSNGGNFELTYASPLTLSAALTNSGTFGVHQNTTLGVDGGFGNSGTLEVDNGFSEAPVTGEGGSSLTITGTLANTGTVQVGNPNLSAPTTVTLGGLTNPAGASFALEGSASHAADLVFSGGGSGFTSNGGNFELTYASPLTLSAALTNSGTFGVHQNTTLGVDGGFGNSGTLEVDNGFSEAPVTGEGGSSLTITGTLANTGTVQVGNPNLSAPTTVTAAALTNSGTIGLLGSTSNPANQASLTVTGAASNAGTVNIPTATSVTVTGAGNAYTQTAGFTNLSGGTLAAPSININGGTLQGLGTVAGALNIASTGSIQAINLANSSLAAVLTVNGNYAQSGGTFDALLHGTGAQIDAVNVGGGDSVHLTGGNLQVSGVAFALGQMFNDIMTFQPGELSGTFATLQGGGNGNSVNLGNGLTLEALYNNAGGNISLEVIPTPPINPASPLISPVAINFGNVRIGTPQQQALSVTNVATTAPQASLDAQVSSAGPPATSNSGAITQLPPGSTDNSSLVVGLSTASAGKQTGQGTVALQSDATTAGCAGAGCITPLPTQTIDLQANVFRLATGSAASPQDIGAARVGIGSLSGNLSVTNTAANDGSSENLDAAISATTPDVTGSSGKVTGLVPGQTDNTDLHVTLDNSSAGAKSGTATVQFQSDGTGIDGGAPIDNGSQVVTVTGNVYTPAVANVLTRPPVDFGIVHVGDGAGTIAKSVTVQNGAAVTALNDVMTGSISAGPTPPFSGSGTLGAGLAPGASSSALQIDLATGTAGIFNGTANLDLSSHDSQLADLSLATSPLSLNAQVNLFAKLALEQTGGDGKLTGGGTSYDLDFGNVVRGSPTQEALLAILNDNPLADQAFTDLLSTSPSGAAVPFSLTGCSANGLPGGDRQSCDVLFDTSSLGRFMDSVTFDVESSNASGYDQIIGDVTLNLDGNIVSSPVPEPGSIAVLASGFFMLFFVVRRERRGR